MTTPVPSPPPLPPLGKLPPPPPAPVTPTCPPKALGRSKLHPSGLTWERFNWPFKTDSERQKLILQKQAEALF